MSRSRYRKKLLKDKSQTSRENYKIQRNLCKKLLRKRKKSYFESFNIKKIKDNRTFWQNVVPSFTKKASKGEKIFQKNIFPMAKSMHIFDNFFTNVSDCNSPPAPPRKKKYTQSLSTIIKTFEKHPSIFNIKKRKLDSVFSFRKTAQEEVSKVLRDLNIKKVIRQVTLPPKLSN